MSEKVNLGRTGFSTSAYLNAIDTTFTQLIPPTPPVEDTATVEEFFNLYNQLFYEIPAEGDVNSHLFLIQKSKEYIGFTEEKDEDIQILLDEITQLREELLSTQKELQDLQISGSLESTNQSSDLQEGTQVTADPFSIQSSVAG